MSIISEIPWYQLTQFNKLLTDLRVGSIDQTQLSVVLEIAAETAVRKVRGQYTTPTTLAKLIAALALRNIENDRLLDPCCGSGTIARAALEYKLDSQIPPGEAAASVLAGDLDPQAVQIATLAMVKPTFMDIPLRIYREDAFKLNPELRIQFQNPSDGTFFSESLGNFNSIASNLPFVSISGQNRYEFNIEHTDDLLKSKSIQLSCRTDITAYFPFIFHSLLSDHGRLVIIISNAWLSTDWGDRFYDQILKYYTIKAIVSSGAGRWFQNSKMVANLVILEKRDDNEKSIESTDFVILNRPIQEISDSPEIASVTSAQIELGQAQNENMRLRSVSRNEIDSLRKKGLGRNAHFVDCNWIRDLPLVPLRNLCKIHRGERRGWDKLFYPSKDHAIEEQYIQPVLKSPNEISCIITIADKDVFCCPRSIEKLTSLRHDGALKWIQRFASETNKVNKPLPQVLTRPGMFWYEMQPSSKAQLVMSINFGERLFVAKLDPPAFVNQRFTRLNGKVGVDIDLLFALLNSAISLFFIGGLGFGRGEGALDLSTSRIKAAMYILDPSVLHEEQVHAIKSAFRPLLKRNLSRAVNECEYKDRQNFDDTAIAMFGVPISREAVYDSLIQLVAIRLTATELKTGVS